MTASVYEQYGPPSVLQVRQIEKPAMQANEVLIRVQATTVNRTDCAMLRARPFIMRFFTGLRKPSKPVLGTDFAGIIEAIGTQVTDFKVGDRVFGFDDLGVCSHAQYITLAQDRAMATIPAPISYEQAAASLEGAHYAYNMLNKVNLKAGEKALVNGASGAIGSAAVQLLKYFGARVTAVCATKNLALVESLGAERVIDYMKEDFTRSGEKFHYIFDAVGKSTFARCKPLLEPGGIYISSELGPHIQNPLLALVTPMVGGKKVIFPFPSNCKRTVLLIKKLLEEGKFTAVIDRIYRMQEIAQAFSYVETGEKTGNVVITYQS
ncbi:NAD(P)-dependent alcohol dehydrogenase [Rhodocytophaga aerolata]|uniref:NAD(P)-dependent alcohol dehydrogenase n=1 Tax=Rhodocytophaga aerolata TaxID=455078 RepID=A0ABT8RFS8_9BACT|nr:NAD(P)-dependent alcohol dehydrogenase [Rhodocytophaga aerolata]MDO1450966.1 NAD(P)-dependent alcohol dehydrogenase [Rhodocytophaga aerolata]